jgi:hypothetical protein
MHQVKVMEDHRHKKLQALREQIQRGEYLVEPSVVAEAIARRVWSIELATERAETPVSTLHRARRTRARDEALSGVRPRAEVLAGLAS